MPIKRKNRVFTLVMAAFLLAGCQNSGGVKKDVEEVEQSETRAQEEIDNAVEKDAEALESEIEKAAD